MKALAILNGHENLKDISQVLGICLPECTLLSTDSGEEVLDLMSAECPDVVLLDLDLDTGGLSVLEKIRHRSRQLPVIVMSAQRDENTIVRALALGADEYVAKPFREADFVASLMELLRKNQPKEDSSGDSNRWGKVMSD